MYLIILFYVKFVNGEVQFWFNPPSECEETEVMKESQAIVGEGKILQIEARQSGEVVGLIMVVFLHSR